ncbi:hypothetical protein F5Y12DRAFT_776597 [Xylaria sp. FL1777]|nr:hypothetical protein F5Y12DRAFT_776597 [Xylaria sp. FL1777]
MPLVNNDLLLPSLVDDLARSDPSRILYSFAKTKDPADGFRDVCAADFARAVDRCSWFIDQHLGPGNGFPTLVYLGPQDLNYAIIVLASIKTGYKLLLVSPRNTVEANLSLLDQMKCNTFLTPPNFPLPVVRKVLDARPMRHVEVPNFHAWLDDSHDHDAEWKPYPYTKTFSEAKAEPFVVLHTSGSTGLPKPILQTHRTVSAVLAFSNIEEKQTTFPTLLKGERVYTTFPLFHCAGITMILPGCLYIGYTIVLAAFPPSAAVVNGVHLHGRVQHTVLAPTTLEELVREPEYLENLSQVKSVTYGGGPLLKATGDLAITKTRLINCLGTTECGVLPGQLCDPQDWQYLRLHPNLGYEYRHVSDDLYEQVIVRDENRLQYQGIFGTFPDLTEWPMKDIYSKHPDPSKGDLWLYRGRADDVIVFSTGEKINPNDMENIINSHPAINSALIAGQGRFQSSLLVEAVNSPADAEDEKRLLDAIWPSVQAANKECPSHGRIHRNMIKFTSAAKPMLRAGKGTVQRRLTLDLYTTELDALYEAASSAPVQQPNTGDGGSYGSVEGAIKAIITSSTDIDARNISPYNDLFEIGLDSLQVTALVRRLNEYVSSRGKPQLVEGKTVYANPNLAALTDAISVIVAGEESSNEKYQEKLEELYQLYTKDLPISGRETSPKTSDSRVVLMTGSTGSLGSYILDSLQSDENVSRIYCLCRGPESFRRQEGVQASKGLRSLSRKVQCLDADLTKSYFGLPTPIYKELLDQVTHVIHNAWQVDFNLSIHSFTRHISFVRRLIDFSSHSRFGAELFFISSISAVSGLQGTVAEQIYTDWTTPMTSGYGQSKFVAERLLDAAAREANIPSAICRVGQVAGPTSAAGEWSKKEWLPSLVASSRYLGKVPDSLGPRLDTIDWIPVDKLGKVIVELAFLPARAYELNTGARVYHAINPHHITWGELLPAISQRLGQGKVVEVVSLGAWIDALRDSASRTEDVAANPAIKLLDFFESLVDTRVTFLSTENTVRISSTLSSVGPVRDDWMDNWMTQWGF